VNKFLVCPATAWSRNVTKLVLTKPLPAAYGNQGRPPHGLPWAIELTKGGRCTLYTGGTGVVRGLRINYGCSNGGALVGGPHKKSRIWTIYFLRKFSSKHLSTVRIRGATW
jgi:hypothetical protein